MKIVVKCSEKNEYQSYDDADAFLVGNAYFAIHAGHSFSNQELKEFVEICRILKKEVHVLVNQIFIENRIPALREYLMFLKELDVDRIYFSDLAVWEIAKKLKIENKCVFYHETLLRTSKEVEAYQKMGIPELVVSPFMRAESWQKCSGNLGITIYGYFPLYYTKRHILDVFSSRHPEVPLMKNSYHLVEKKREESFLFLKERFGTTIFSSTPLDLFPDYEEYIRFKASFVIVDAIFLRRMDVKILLSTLKKDGPVDSPFHQGTNHFFHHRTGVKK